jgi:8-oxo-dGTP diphosphatase
MIPRMSEHFPLLVTAGVVFRDGCILVARRKTGSHLEGLWEFPGGKLKPNEAPEESLIREFREELGVEIRVGRILDVVFHRYPEKSVLLLFYACELVEGEPRPLDVMELAWVKRADLPGLDWVPADVAFIRKLAETSDV